MTAPLVTALIPHYRTLDLTRLCLRLVRKHTEDGRLRVIVIDNGSADESSVYLRSLRWIDYRERTPAPGEQPALAHARALDAALLETRTPFVLSMHTDTLVKRAGWLDVLLEPLLARPELAGVGSWKLEQRTPVQRLAKALERRWHRLTDPLRGRHRGPEDGEGENHLYLRSHCALYRTSVLMEHGLRFAEGGPPAGKTLHRRIETLGHSLLFLPAERLVPYIEHLNHATMVLNPEFALRRGTRRRGLRRIRRVLHELHADEILGDHRLDA
jgi:hypothetical protein